MRTRLMIAAVCLMLAGAAAAADVAVDFDKTPLAEALKQLPGMTVEVGEAVADPPALTGRIACASEAVPEALNVMLREHGLVVVKTGDAAWRVLRESDPVAMMKRVGVAVDRLAAFSKAPGDAAAKARVREAVTDMLGVMLLLQINSESGSVIDLVTNDLSAIAESADPDVRLGGLIAMSGGLLNNVQTDGTGTTRANDLRIAAQEYRRTLRLVKLSDVLLGHAEDEDRDAELRQLLTFASNTSSNAYVPGETIKAMKTQLYAKRLVVAGAAAQILSRRTSLDELLAIIEDGLKNHRDAVGMRMLFGLAGRAFNHGDQATQLKNVERLQDVVLAHGGPEYMKEYMQRFGHYLNNQVDKRYPLLEALMAKAPADTLAAMLDQGNYTYYFFRSGTFEGFLGRLEKMLAAEDTADAAGAARLACLVCSGAYSYMNSNDRKKVEPRIRKLAQDGMRRVMAAKDATDRMRLDVLLGVVTRNYHQGPAWVDFPLTARECAAKLMEKVLDPELGDDVITLVERLQRNLQYDTRRWDLGEFKPALTAACEAVMKEGSWVAQVRVLCILAVSRDQDQRDAAARELEARVMKPREALSDELLRNALNALQQAPQGGSDTFAEYLLGGIVEGRFSHNTNSYAFNVLQNIVYRRRHDADPKDPAWVERTREKSWAMLAGKGTDQNMRYRALNLYVAAAGPEAGANLEALARDKDQDPNLRVSAARKLGELMPETTLFKEALKEYEKLPAHVRAGFASAAANMPKAPEAEAFIIRALADDEGDMKHRRSNIIYSIHRPPSPALRTTVEALKDDPQLKHAVQSRLKYWDQQAQQGVMGMVRNGLATVAAAAANAEKYARDLETLKDAEWKKEDPVEKHLTWYSTKAGLVHADGNAKVVTRHTALLGLKDLKIAAIAFGAKKVWLGTDKGLIAWDRKTKAFSLYLVNGAFADTPVKKLDLKDGVLQVTIIVKDADRAFSFDTARQKWVEAK